MEINKIYTENCIDTMKRMTDNFIDLIVTSPPYDNLRDYKGYSFPFEDIAKELYRVTKEGGVVVWIVGDSTIDGSESGTSFRQALYFKSLNFLLHDTMVYEKNGCPFPQQTRYYNNWEYMFVFSKGKPKTFNPIKDRKNRWPGESWGNKTSYSKDGAKVKHEKFSSKDYGVRFNIWKYNVGFGYSTKDDTGEHPAIFPEALIRDHILSWSNERDLVYDPFMGSGTTAKMAHLLNRDWIGSEISEEYTTLAYKRLKPYLTQTQLFR